MLTQPLQALKSVAYRALSGGVDRVSQLLGGEVLLLDPAARLPKVERLYELAKRDQWNYSELRAAAPNLDVSRLLPEERRAVARVVSQLYYGERGALLISAQLTAMVRDQESSAFLTTQCFDEARHMEVFAGMARDLDELHPVNPFLQALLTDLLQTRHLPEKLLGMNLLVEGLALSVFHHMIKVFKNHPRLSGSFEQAVIIRPLEKIILDESRHVGFGMVYLPELVRGLSLRRRVQLMGRQLFWMSLLYGSVKVHEKDSALLGLSFMDVLGKILEDHQRRAEEMGIGVVIGGGGFQRLIPTCDKIINQVLQTHVEVSDFSSRAA